MGKGRLRGKKSEIEYTQRHSEGKERIRKRSEPPEEKVTVLALLTCGEEKGKIGRRKVNSVLSFEMVIATW